MRCGQTTPRIGRVAQPAQCLRLIIGRVRLTGFVKSMLMLLDTFVDPTKGKVNVASEVMNA